MYLRRIASIAFWIALAAFLIRHPETGAQTVKAIGGGFALLADALSRFIEAF
ncbi:hypothetical protein [Actinomadura litoris]|uniref:hypothetical protein n=1 Tax=Actinomadura litoris TaxID=2678616 RepID=UPI001FA6E097|nr:hypothetical protein [Actinomadura litoris]